MSSIVKGRCFVRLFPTPTAQLDESRAILIAITAISYDICAPIMNLFGFVANTLSLVTYKRMGLTDSVTILFFAMSLSDLCRSITISATWFCEILSVYACVNPDLNPLKLLLFYVSAMFFDISALTIICISVQRCACVAFPLQFRGVFTRYRITCFIAIVYVLVFSWYILFFAEQRIEIRMDSVTNITVFKIAYTDVLNNIMYINFSVHVAGSIITQVIILISLVTFTKALIASFRFRLQNSTPLTKKINILQTPHNGKESSSLPFRHCSYLEEFIINVSQTQDLEKLQVYVTDLTNKQYHSGSLVNSQMMTDLQTKSINKYRRQTQKHSRKETQMIKVVTLTSVIFMICHFPTMCIYITNLFIPDFSRDGNHQLSFAVLVAIKSFFEYLNSDLNIFVYLACNSKFQETFYSIIKL